MAGRAFVSSLAVVVDGDDVLLARQRFRGDTWGLPGGWVRRREEPAIGCEREVREETGIEVNVVAIVASELHTLNGRPARYGGVTLAFYCTPRAPIDRTRPPRSVELSELRWVPHVLCDGFVHGFSLRAIDAAFAHG